MIAVFGLTTLVAGELEPARDTGSAAFVDFTSPTVQRYRLLERSGLVDTITESGGRAASKRGAIDWFELGGRRYAKPITGFQLADRGLFASPYLDGNIGVRLFEQSILVLDLHFNRVALAPHDVSVWYATLRNNFVLLAVLFVFALAFVFRRYRRT